MSIGRPKPALELSAEEREELSGFAASRSLSHSLVLRAKLVLWSVMGFPIREIAERLDWSKATVGKWRQRFIQHRIQGLYDELYPSTFSAWHRSRRWEFTKPGYDRRPTFAMGRKYRAYQFSDEVRIAYASCVDLG